MNTLPMFDIEPATKKAAEPTGRRTTRKPPNPDAIRWSQYKGATRLPCDDCIGDLIGAGGGPPARDAKYRRTQHGRDAVYCTRHMQLHRELDGLDPLKQV